MALAVMRSQLIVLRRCRRLISWSLVSVLHCAIMLLVVSVLAAFGVVFLFCLLAFPVLAAVAQ